MAYAVRITSKSSVAFTHEKTLGSSSPNPRLLALLASVIPSLASSPLPSVPLVLRGWKQLLPRRSPQRTYVERQSTRLRFFVTERRSCTASPAFFLAPRCLYRLNECYKRRCTSTDDAGSSVAAAPTESPTSGGTLFACLASVACVAILDTNDVGGSERVARPFRFSRSSVRGLFPTHSLGFNDSRQERRRRREGTARADGRQGILNGGLGGTEEASDVLVADLGQGDSGHHPAGCANRRDSSRNHRGEQERRVVGERVFLVLVARLVHLVRIVQYNEHNIEHDVSDIHLVKQRIKRDIQRDNILFLLHSILKLRFRKNDKPSLKHEQRPFRLNLLRIDTASSLSTQTLSRL
ncbi:hypothetical protein BJY59DRAFT_43824 [Rhodotorula toruloides]